VTAAAIRQIRKLVSYRAGAAPGGAGLRVGCSCGGLKDYGVAKGLELADMAALAAFGIDVGGVVAGARSNTERLAKRLPAPGLETISAVKQ
jgi:hypothetical protein